MGLVFGVANKRSIAWGIAKAWADAGAKLIFNYQGDRLKENVEELAATFGADTPVAPCDVSRDEDITKFFDFVKTKTPREPPSARRPHCAKADPREEFSFLQNQKTS